MTCQTACTLRNLFLNTPIGYIGIDGLVHDMTQTGFQKFGSDSSTYCKSVSLS